MVDLQMKLEKMLKKVVNKNRKIEYKLISLYNFCELLFLLMIFYFIIFMFQLNNIKKM